MIVFRLEQRRQQEQKELQIKREENTNNIIRHIQAKEHMQAGRAKEIGRRKIYNLTSS